ncbi:MAG: EamA family transporter, partial [Thermoanaerobaculia bacterium]|nr:EamA family transporter [Thermoanaerobaculia bacterium]
PPHLPSVAVLMIACASWAIGSLYGRTADLPSSPLLATGMQMLAGGTLLLGAGGLAGEWSHVDPATFSTTSMLAFGYLVFFGAIVAFSAYTWLLRNAEPTLVATYAYVNPVVAVVLGWLLGGEPLGSTTFVAMGLILGAVVLVGSGAGHGGRSEPAEVVERPPELTQEPVDLGLESGYALENCA